MSELMKVSASLSRDPLYILSTAGQELFHSNFLFWLARDHHEVAARPVFAALGLPDMHNGQQTNRVIKREWRHTDLYYDSGLGSRRLVLENKVLAVPTPGQLRGYHQELVAKAGVPEAVTAFTLLSLIPPAEVPEPWVHVDYRELLEPLTESAASLRGFERGLVEQYSGLVGGLVSLRDALAAHRDEGRWDLTREERDTLEDARLLSLAQKLLMAMLANDIRAALGGPDLVLEVGLTRGQGLVTFHGEPDRAGDIRGWQLQGGQFRRFVMVGAARLRGANARQRREEYVAERHAEHFDFGSAQLAAASSRKDWLGYNPDFVYQYMRVPDSATWEDVVGLCAAATTLG